MKKLVAAVMLIIFANQAFANAPASVVCKHKRSFVGLDGEDRYAESEIKLEKMDVYGVGIIYEAKVFVEGKYQVSIKLHQRPNGYLTGQIFAALAPSPARIGSACSNNSCELILEGNTQDSGVLEISCE